MAIQDSVSSGGSDATPLRRRVAAAWPYGLILLLGILVLLPRLGDYGFWDPWEPKYAQSVREMLDRGSYMIPYYRDEARLAKPILAYWSIMAGSALFGLNEVGARIGGACAALGSLLALYYAVSRLRGRRAALLSALVLLTLPQFYFLARQATPDVFLLSGLGSSMLFLCLGLFGPEERRRTHLAVAYACFGIAVLAKGPLVAGSIFLATLAVFLVARIDWGWFWRPELRRETTTLAMALASGGLAVLTLASIAFLFGTSPKVWSWSTDVHQVLLQVRERIAAFDARWHAAELLLLLTGAAALLASAGLYRRSVGRGRRSLVVPAVALSASVLALAVVALTRDDRGVTMLLASSAASLAVAGLVATFVWRFLRLPAVWQVVGGRLGFVGGQLLVFGAVVLLIDGPWYLTVLVKKTSLFVNDFIVYNHITRATETINSSGGFDYYWHALAYGLFPWSCLLPVVLGLALSPHGRNPERTADIETYLFLACVVTLAAFSSAVTKFSHYLAPALLPAATLIGTTLDRLLRTRSVTLRRAAWGTALICYAAMAKDLLAEHGSIYLVGTYTVKRWVPEDAAPGPFFAAVLGVLGLAILLSFFWRSRAVVASLVAAAAAFAFYCTVVFIPALSAHKTMKGLCESWIELRDDRRILGFHGDVKHGVYYYCDGDVAVMGANEFVGFMAPGPPAFGIVERRKLRAVATRYRREHPGRILRIADDSHFRYVLTTNSGPAVPTTARLGE